MDTHGHLRLMYLFLSDCPVGQTSWIFWMNGQTTNMPRVCLTVTHQKVTINTLQKRPNLVSMGFSPAKPQHGKLHYDEKKSASYQTEQVQCDKKPFGRRLMLVLLSWRRHYDVDHRVIEKTCNNADTDTRGTERAGTKKCSNYKCTCNLLGRLLEQHRQLYWVTQKIQHTDVGRGCP